MNDLGQQVFMILVAVLVIGMILFFAINMMRKNKSGLDIKKNQVAWKQIEDSLNGGNKVMYQMAVLSADKLLDQAMRDLNIPGETMGDRLKSANNRFSSVDDVWSAHKLRNRIAHESDVDLNLVGTKKALSSFKKALKDLGAI